MNAVAVRQKPSYVDVVKAYNQIVRLYKALKGKYDELEIKHNALERQIETSIKPDAKNKIFGWSISNRQKDGYFRAGRRIDGTCRTINLGRDYTTEKARLKIIKKNRQFGLNDDGTVKLEATVKTL